jgi:hypothetical protein
MVIIVMLHPIGVLLLSVLSSITYAHNDNYNYSTEASILRCLQMLLGKRKDSHGKPTYPTFGTTHAREVKRVNGRIRTANRRTQPSVLHTHEK